MMHSSANYGSAQSGARNMGFGKHNAVNRNISGVSRNICSQQKNLFVYNSIPHCLSAICDLRNYHGLNIIFFSNKCPFSDDHSFLVDQNFVTPLIVNLSPV